MEADFEIDTYIDHNFHLQPSERLKKWESSLPSEYWDYRKQWEENPKNKHLENFPIHLDIEATTACNMKCIMCPREEMVQNGTFWKVQSFDFDIYKKLIDEGVKNGLKSIKYNYLGEPTINKNIIKMIKYAKSAGVLDVMFNTNGYLLDENMAKKLIDSGLDKLFFSFDSPYRENYNKIRIGGDYDKVLKNIKNFMKIRNEMKSLKPFTRVSMVLMKENENEIEDYKKLFEPIVDAVAFVDYLEHTGHKNPDSNRSILNLKDKKEKKYCCPQLWQRMFIHPDGVVTVCCIDSAREMKMGNVFEEPAKDIWLNQKYQNLRELHATGRIDEIPTCSKCQLAKY